MVDVATWGRWLDGGDQGVYPFTGSAARLWSDYLADPVDISENATPLPEYLVEPHGTHRQVQFRSQA